MDVPWDLGDMRSSFPNTMLPPTLVLASALASALALAAWGVMVVVMRPNVAAVIPSMKVRLDDGVPVAGVVLGDEKAATLERLCINDATITQVEDNLRCMIVYLTLIDALV